MNGINLYYLLLISLLYLTSCNTINIFVVASENVSQDNKNQFQYETKNFHIKYDWWADMGVPIISFKNIGQEEINIDWSNSYFIINMDTLKCFLKQSELRRFEGPLLPPMTEPYSSIKSLEEIEFEGYPFVTRKKYPAKGEFFTYPKVMSPSIQTFIMMYYINDQPYEIKHTFFLSSIYRTTMKKLKKSNQEVNLPYDRFYRKSDLDKNSSILEIMSLSLDFINISR